MREELVGKYIAAKRKEIGLTQDELGKMLGFTGKAISKWERGLCFPDVDTLHALSRILLCSVEELINGDEFSPFSSDKRTPDSTYKGQIENNSDEYKITLKDMGRIVSPLIFGANIEHTRSTVTGGLSAQMLKNRKFVGMPQRDGSAIGWFVFGEKCYAMVGNAVVEGRSDHTVESVGSYTRHSDIGYHMHRRYECNSWQIQNFSSLAGFGQRELFIEKDKEYEFRIVLHSDSAATLSVALTSRFGKTVYAEQKISVDSSDWATYKVNLISNSFDDDAELRISFCEKTRIVVGAVSLMPTDNFHGMRRDIVQSLKDMKLKFLRWPGGNFAGEYNWFDGLLEPDMRAPSESHISFLTQPHTLGYDFGELNTDDFIALCREIGAEPSLTLNTTWNTPEENACWVEYCNGDETTKYGKLRIERGFKEPYNVKYWSLGNEAGYGHMEGDNSPAGYCVIAKNNAEQLLGRDKNLVLCSSGFQPSKQWTEGANNKLRSLAVWTALHNYVNFPDYTQAADLKQAYSTAICGVEENRNKLHELKDLLDEEISVSFDEWNCWYNWYRPSDVFTGIFGAKMLNMFIEEQKNSRLVASAVFQPINEGCIEVYKNRTCLSPMGQAFSVLGSHGGARLMHCSENVVASLKDDQLTVTIINDSYDTEKSYSIEGAPEKVFAKILSATEVGPFSQFAKTEREIQSNDISVPPLSITLIRFEMK